MRSYVRFQTCRRFVQWVVSLQTLQNSEGPLGADISLELRWNLWKCRGGKVREVAGAMISYVWLSNSTSVAWFATLQNRHDSDIIEKIAVDRNRSALVVGIVSASRSPLHFPLLTLLSRKSFICPEITWTNSQRWSRTNPNPGSNIQRGWIDQITWISRTGEI